MASPKTADDLVISHRYSFDFSWKPRDDAISSLINPDAIHYFTEDCRQFKFQKLKRFKAVHLPRRLITKILDELTHGTLEQLEIEKLELHQLHERNYKYDHLRLLSVDQIKFFDDNDNPIFDPVHSQTFHFCIKSNCLKTVYLGDDCINYIKFSNKSTITELTIDRDPKRKITEFTSLISLRSNRVEFLNIHDVLTLAQKGQLKYFYCNTHTLDSTAYQPTEAELQSLAKLYQELKTRSLYDLTVYFNNVPLALDKTFEEYHFKHSLLNCYFHNSNGKLDPVPCQSVTKLDYSNLLDTECCLKRNIETNFSLFLTLFTNIRVCVLDNSDGESAIDPKPFLKFLSSSTALAELKICNSGFPAKWYDNLSSLATKEPASLKYLNKFVLSESIGFAGHLNFEFLSSFQHLLRFSTNLATTKTMLDLVRAMPAQATYGFQFWNSMDAYHYDVVVQRTKFSQASLYIRKRDPDVRDGQIFLDKEMPFQDAVQYLVLSTHLYCGHWMEDLPPKP